MPIKDLRPNGASHRDRVTLFAFEPIRADRGSLGVRHAETPPTSDGALLLCRQAAGACEFSAANVGGRLLPGDMVLIDAASGVRFTGDVAAVERLVVPRSRLPISPEMIETAHGRVIPAHSSFGIVLGTLLNSVRSPIGEPSSKRREADDVLMRALFAAAASAAVEGVAEASADDPLVRAIRDHIEAHLADARLSPEAIGRHFGLSRASLYRLWRPSGGIAGHIRERRLFRAHLYLCAARDRRTSVVEVAHRCGFSNVGSFVRLYRSHYGCTPNDTMAQAIQKQKRSEAEWDSRRGQQFTSATMDADAPLSDAAFPGRSTINAVR